MKEPPGPTAEDLQEMRDEMEGNLDFVPTDDQLREACRANPDMVWKALQWSWGDTEVRDDLYVALRKIAGTWAR